MAMTRMVTADDLMTMPDDGRRYELIRGELREVAPAGFGASHIAIRIGGRIDAYVDEHGLGEVTGADGGYLFEIAPDTVRAPDVAFTLASRLPPRHALIGYSAVIPDLVVEVVSPSDARREVEDKVAYYMGQGVPLVWTVWPKPRTVVAHRPGREPQTFREGDVLTAEDLLPGFRLPIEDVFR
ncbi:MAG: Uma2 family endonuclease [Chloroflexota bacterium]|nr:Uma2 family endonuclease [Chloroflexota bacterium]